MKALKATIAKIPKKTNPYNTSKGIYNNGIDNGYTEKIQLYRDNSVTGLSVSGLMAQYVLGRGFGDFDKVKLNLDQSTVLELATDASEDVTDWRGFFVHITYNGGLKAVNFKVLPFSSCRVGEEDSGGYSGKIHYKEDWHGKKASEDAIIYDVFNNNEKVLREQIKKAGGIKKYKGQVAFFSMQPRLVYPLARMHAAANDADTEAEISNYKNMIVHEGFLGKIAVITPPMINDDIDDDEDGLDAALDLSDEDIEIIEKEKRINKRDLESEEKAFAEVINEFGGVNGQNKFLHVQLKYEGDDLTKAIKFEKIDTNLNPDFFEKMEISVKDNVAAAYNNCPQVLIKNPDSAFFSGSGEQLLQAKLMYQENTRKDRKFLEAAINKLWTIHKDYDNEYKDIIDLIDKPIEKTANNGNSFN